MDNTRNPKFHRYYIRACRDYATTFWGIIANLLDCFIEFALAPAGDKHISAIKAMSRQMEGVFLPTVSVRRSLG
ncbi:MAG: hypothetical protein WBF33_10230 [Candidatus Nitrosopolaris sp.]